MYKFLTLMLLLNFCVSYSFGKSKKKDEENKGSCTPKRETKSKKSIQICEEFDDNERECKKNTTYVRCKWIPSPPPPEILYVCSARDASNKKHIIICEDLDKDEKKCREKKDKCKWEKTLRDPKGKRIQSAPKP